MAVNPWKTLLISDLNLLDYNGVYKITNIITNDCYIGSCSSKKKLKNRLNEHFILLQNNKHHSIILQRAWNKYEFNNFTIEILETCPPNFCIEIEQYYIDIFKPKYNVCKKAGSRLGCKQTPRKLSEKEIENIRIRSKLAGMPRKTLEAAWKSTRGKKINPEMVEKRRASIKLAWKNRDTTSSMLNLKRQQDKMRGMPVSEEKRQMLSLLGRKKVKGVNRTTGEVLVFDSAREASRQLKVDYFTLTAACRKIKPSYKNFIWEYIND